jgi:hypothetical protein
MGVQSAGGLHVPAWQNGKAYLAAVVQPLLLCRYYSHKSIITMLHVNVVLREMPRHELLHYV